MTQLRVDNTFKTILKFLHTILLGVTIPFVIYSTSTMKSLYDFVQTTKTINLRQDESLAIHTLQFNRRQQVEQEYDRKFAVIETQLTYIFKILKF